MNPRRAELLQMVKEAENEAAEIKRRALEEAESIRSSARVNAEGSDVPHGEEKETGRTDTRRNGVEEASEILRFAQSFATEARAEAEKFLADARASEEEILSSARTEVAVFTSSSSATAGDKQKRRRERDANKKRMKYWGDRSGDNDQVTESRASIRAARDRTVREIVTALLTKLDLSVATGLKDMRSTLQRVKGAQRRDYMAAKHNLLLALAGNNVMTKRCQSSLAWALGVKRDNIGKGAKARAVLDSDHTERFPSGKCKSRSDKFSGELVTLVEEFWRSKALVSPRKDDEVRKRIAKGIYETHQVYWIEETEVREMCCFCSSCLDEDWDNCSNSEYTGPWTLYNVHPRKPAEIIDYVAAMGHGQGITDQWDEGSLADLVEVGEFFAVEAEWPNDYNAEFWILQCTKPLHVLPHIITDAYGETHDEGSSVLEGIWYQQFGKSPTCFVRYDSAPASVVAAQRVIHARFGLNPTGVLKNNPSFKLPNDTLEAILAYLQS
ncbi:hypothetical protein R1sor_018005 [Riccia sorocarpa]|uniref:Uncharacterized protein n=1 Tax=Riccia sorocarpa TaxID=122646 RepID=A0ABD3I8H7_9MARC